MDLSSPYARPGYRNLVLSLLMLVYMLTTIDRGIVMALIEPIKREIGLTDTQAAILIGPAFAGFFVLAGIPLGRLADRGSRRNILAACLLAWSGMTALCGMAQSFLQLVLGRVGVGIGEAGGPPAAVAIISDIFPAENRASASAIFYSGASIGVMISFGLGGWVAAHNGWRTAFLAASIPGIILGLLILLLVREPPRGMSENISVTAGTTLAQTLRFIWIQRSLRHLIAGSVLAQAVGAGAMAFFVSYMLRSLGMSLAGAGLTVALCYGIGSSIGVITFGWLADRLAQKDARWRSRLPAITIALSIVWFAGILLVRTREVMTLCLLLWSFSCSGYTASSYALFQSLVRVSMRATMGSVQFILLAVVSGSVGPMLVGIASDKLASSFGAGSLRVAMLCLIPLYAWSVIHYVLAERTLKTDLADALETHELRPVSAVHPL